MIGVFDSGSGGLTVLKAILSKIPSADIVYFGDIKKAPYGEKSRQEIADLTINAFKLLQENGATSIVSACNSVSASVTISLFDTFSIEFDRLIEMVGPTVSAFNGTPLKVLLCATPATIESHIYQNAFNMIGKEIEPIPIEGLAGLIEDGASSEMLVEKIKKSFKDINVSEYGVLVLACTHYPLISGSFKEAFPNIKLFDPAGEVAERVKDKWWPREVGDGRVSFLISQESEVFKNRVEEMFPNMEYKVTIV